MTFSDVNTLFELAGVAASGHNLLQAFKVRPAGVSWPMLALSTLWSFESGPYYLSHGESVAAVCAALRCMLRAAWLVLALRPRSI